MERRYYMKAGHNKKGEIGVLTSNKKSPKDAEEEIEEKAKKLNIKTFGITFTHIEGKKKSEGKRKW